MKSYKYSFTRAEVIRVRSGSDFYPKYFLKSYFIQTFFSSGGETSVSFENFTKTTVDENFLGANFEDEIPFKWGTM